MKLKKKGKTHRGVLSQFKGDILDIEKAIPIGGDGVTIKNNGSQVKIELVNKFHSPRRIFAANCVSIYSLSCMIFPSLMISKK